MIAIVTPAEMRLIDAAAPESLDELIDRAAWHVARTARQMLGGVYGRRVTAIAGPGNNGADATIAAHLLRRWGVHVDLVGPDAKNLAPVDLVIDGAFGTGTNRAYMPPTVPRHVPILAVDIPSGLDGLTGIALGNPLRADRTVTFAALKPGLLLGDGPELAGQVDVVDIGLDTAHATAWLVTEHDVATRLPRKRRTDHKWKRAVYVVGGSTGMYGAPFFASQAALRSGAGIAWCGLPAQNPPGVASEIVFKTLPSSGWCTEVLADVSRFGAVVVGCGMGAESSVDVAMLATSCTKPVVVDGGGLRALGRLPQLSPHVVLTPHDAEFESLAGERPGPDRFAATRSLAKLTGATVLLKGPLTIVAAPDGRCLASASGDERLATAGSGDVLAGVIGALLAGGLEPLWAGAAGAWLHGAAGQQAQSHGFVASDLLTGLPQVANRLLAEH